MTTAGLELDHGRILLAGTVFVHLERALAGGEPSPAAAPARSYGLAPTALNDEGGVIAALGPGEAVWLGLQAFDPGRPVTLRVETEGKPALAALTPPDHWLPGLFGPGELTVVAEAPVAARVPIRLVDLDTFAAATGTVPGPLDPEHGYGGWRLP